MELKKLFNTVYQGKTILVTGHTGFKGSWLAYWLTRMGANVVGYSLDVPTNPSHFHLLGLKKKVTHTLGDIRNKAELERLFNSYKPDIVFHLAAQSLVRPSYSATLETFSTNVMGTANILECCRTSLTTCGIINVTSDKCYENLEDNRPYKETDRMGGYDPYSASKGCAELVANSYRSSFFNEKEYDNGHKTIIASVRAGNVIGGGDWAKDRLIPDLVKNAIENETTTIRSPQATRPWQHVLEPLSGYLLLGQRILEGDVSVSCGWNFGPIHDEALSVSSVIKYASESWHDIKFNLEPQNSEMHEAQALRLDCAKANERLKWFPVWTAKEAIHKSIIWYKQYKNYNEIVTEDQLQEYILEASIQKYNWTI